MNEIEKLTKRIQELESQVTDLDRRRRMGWRRYFLKERISLPKLCPKCRTGLLILKPASNGGVYAACSNYPVTCSYYIKDKKKDDTLNAYNI